MCIFVPLHLHLLAVFTGTADVYSLAVMIAEVTLKFLNVPGRVRRPGPEVNADWDNVIRKGHSASVSFFCVCFYIRFVITSRHRVARLPVS